MNGPGGGKFEEDGDVVNVLGGVMKGFWDGSASGEMKKAVGSGVAGFERRPREERPRAEEEASDEADPQEDKFLLIRCRGL